MSLYKEFSELLPYLQSVRKLKNYFSFDVNIPIGWKLPKKFVEENKIMEQETKDPSQRLISFVSEITEEDVEKTSNNIKGIIKFNLEREEKERLFEDRVKELKNLFEKQSLQNLQSLKFEISKNKITLNDGNEFETYKMVREGEIEGQN